ncbi:flagellar hook-length control protein FliK [Terrabacter sp. NPDC080008]|uniref:flagellar hook-length control protein FliK n=1 Tax=Terrabacter sp. NPDC080008 TaxID=3155176 RepID=UPI00344BBBFE
MASPVVTQVTTPHTASAPAPASPPLPQQLGAPVLRLATGAAGEHVLTVHVAPDHLGPVTVQARIDAGGVRIELFSPTEAGRAAVHAALPELRRDLAGAGLGASLDLSHRDAPAGQPATADPGSQGGQGGALAGQREGSRAPEAPTRSTAGAHPQASTPSPHQPLPSTSQVVLDVLA